MPLHLSTLDKLGVALAHLKAQFSNNPVVRDASLSQRADALLAVRTRDRAAALKTRQRLESLNDYRGWCSKFHVSACPASLNSGEWTAEFRDGQPLDWIVQNAFDHNRGLLIDLIFDDGQRSSLKSVEWRFNGQSNILWSA